VRDSGALLAFSPLLQAWALRNRSAAERRSTRSTRGGRARSAVLRLEPRWNQWQRATRCNVRHLSARTGSRWRPGCSWAILERLVRLYDERVGQWAPSLYFGAQEAIERRPRGIVYPQAAPARSALQRAVRRVERAGGVQLPLACAELHRLRGLDGRRGRDAVAFARHPVQVCTTAGRLRLAVQRRRSAHGALGKLALSLHGQPNVDFGLLYWGTNMLNPGIALGGIGGTLCLDRHVLLFRQPGSGDADGLREVSLPLATTLPPVSRCGCKPC